MVRRQPILEARLPRPVKSFLQWYERHVLKVDGATFPIDRPVFLLGMPRSGTTMLQDILCSHPEIAFINNTMSLFPDCFCVIEHYRRRLRLDFESDRYLADSVSVSASSPSDAINMWGRWFRLDMYDLSYRPRSTADFPEAVIETIYALIRRVLWCYRGERTRFFNKALAVMPYVDILPHIFPNARFVHIIRDARATANSMLKLYRTEVEHQRKTGAARQDPVHGEQVFVSYPRFPRLPEYQARFGLDDIRTTANLWNDEVTYVDSVRDKLDHFCEVRYEDILASPAKELGRVLEFCGLAPIDRSGDAFAKKLRKIGVLRHSNRYDHFQLVEDICASNMRKHGYAVS
jgi:hypothetical protein